VDEHVIASLTRHEAEAPVRVDELRCAVHSRQLTSRSDHPP
jgi:hypothetical protein